MNKSHAVDDWMELRENIAAGVWPSDTALATMLRSGKVLPPDIAEYVAGRLDGTIRRKRGQRSRVVKSEAEVMHANMLLFVKLKNYQFAAIAAGKRGARIFAEELVAAESGIGVPHLKKRIASLNQNPELAAQLELLNSDPVRELNVAVKKQMQAGSSHELTFTGQNRSTSGWAIQVPLSPSELQGEKYGKPQIKLIFVPNALIRIDASPPDPESDGKG